MLLVVKKVSFAIVVLSLKVLGNEYRKKSLGIGCLPLAMFRNIRY